MRLFSHVKRVDIRGPIGDGEIFRDFGKSDLSTIQFFSSLAGMAFPGFDFSAVVERLRGTLEAELDFKEEHSNGLRCAREMNKFFPRGDVVVPEVIESKTTTRVLTTKLVKNAVRVTDVDGILKLGLSVRDVDNLMIDAFAKQLFRSGFVHADPHPGNLLVTRHPNDPRKPQLHILDHGLYTQLEDTERAALADFWRHVVLHNDSEAHNCLKRAFGVDRHDVFATMLFQRPYRPNMNSMTTHLSDTDVDTLRNIVMSEMEAVTEMLSVLPSALSLVLRNTVTVRANHKELGAPAHRLQRMCFEAISGTPSLRWYRRWWEYALAYVLINWDAAVYAIEMKLLKTYHPEEYDRIRALTVAA
eukprot:PhM_4_TR17460/c0_g1_i3/m.85769/K08869/ADCK, ABC1; aarF domain-containing kinase